MKLSSPLPDPVQWSEGMLLSPHHLQQDHHYWHAQLGHRIACAAPDAWGVLHLRLDDNCLEHGRIGLAELDCVLPDGAVIGHPGEGARRPLECLLPAPCEGAPALCVFVVVRRAGDGAAVSGNEERRYDPGAAAKAADENTGLDHQPVERLRLRYELAAYPVGATPPANLVACPLLHIERNGEGRLVVGSYHPPMLRLDASDFLAGAGLRARAAALLQRIWNKAEELAAGAEGSDSADGAGRHNAARVLAACLPPLDICVADPALHPRELYRALAHAAGQLATLAARPLPLRMRPYAHRDCIAQFAEVLRYLDDKLAAVRSDYERHRFAPFEEGFSRSLFAGMDDELVVELKPQPGHSAEQAAAWLDGANIASDALIRTVQAQRQRGAAVQRLDAAQARRRRLPADALLFLITNARIHSAGRQAFESGKPLLILAPDQTHKPAQMFLYRPTHQPAPHGAPHE